MAIGRLDDFRVPNGAARLDDGGDAGSGGEVDAVAEREEAVRRQHGAGRVVARLPGFANIHPYQDPSTVQGALQLMCELQEMLGEISGFDEVALQPVALGASLVEW